MALNGSEPVRENVIKRFAEAFKPCGFDLAAFCPGYGLAEATLKVTAVRTKDMPIFYRVQADMLAQNRVVEATEHQQNVHCLTGCGHTEIDTKIIIVHPELLTTCASNQVGEIWVSGSTVAQGYWRRTEETKRTFQAYLADTGEGPFLRTGDLGFLKDGELFVTGRIKDVIIIRGRNYYPQDIELTVQQSHPALRSHWGAAFAVVVDGEERLVVAQEVERSYLRKLNADEVIKAIRQAVSEHHELKVYAVLLLKTASIPKTSSGKIQRHVCQTGFLAGNLDIVADWVENFYSKPEFLHLDGEGKSLIQQVQIQQQSFSCRNNFKERSHLQQKSQTAEAIQTWLVVKISQRLRIEPRDIDIREPLTCYGLDSMTVASLSGELGLWLKRKVSLNLMYEHPTIEALTRHLAEQTDISDTKRSI
jgi:acyl carrier protein